MESQSHERISGHISTIKEDNLEIDDDFEAYQTRCAMESPSESANIVAEIVASSLPTSQSAEAMLITEAYPLHSMDDYGQYAATNARELDIINEQTEQSDQTYGESQTGDQFDSDLYEQRLKSHLLNSQHISTDFNTGFADKQQTDIIDENALYGGNDNKDLLESDSVINSNTANLLESESSIGLDTRSHNYELNDPFKTPEHVAIGSQMSAIIENRSEDTDLFASSVSPFSVPYETVSTNFGVDSASNIENYKADESSFNLLDFDSSQAVDESVVDEYHSDSDSDHSRNTDDDVKASVRQMRTVVTPNESTSQIATSLLEAANRDAEHILINSGGIAAKPPNLEHLRDNDDSFSQNYCVDYKQSTDILEQKQTENIVRFDNTMENSDVIATSTSSGDIDRQCGCAFAPYYWWFNKNQLHPTVAELLYWRDPRKSGIVFAIGLILLISLAYFSIISVFAYASLAALSVTLSFRIYKNILQAVQKTSEGHPFKEYLEAEITPSNERVHQVVDSLLNNYNFTINKLRSVFLVEDIIDSLKFVILFWCLTYIGSWFNGLTLVILAYVASFSLPKVYEMNKTNIDLYLQLACTHINDITSKIRAKIPFPSRKEKDN